MVKNHGGDLNAPRPRGVTHEVTSSESGHVNRIHNNRLGLAIIEMGGGRKKLGDQLNHSVGIECLVRIGDQVDAGQLIARVFCDDPSAATYAKELVAASINIGEAVTPPNLIEELLG
jgi:thymidine phosphorylase